jgi:hypothetical protein
MSSSCIIQNCALNCCNSTGLCPSSITGCYYFYSNYIPEAVASLAVGAIIGIVIGGILLLAGIIALIVCCCRRCRAKPAYMGPSA